MNSLLHFTPRAELSAQKNVDSFIVHAKKTINIWSNLEGFDWDSALWPTHHGQVRLVNLSSRKLHRSNNPEKDNIMASPFCDFAKAYLRYNQFLKPTKSFKSTVRALQLLESALIELGSKPCITQLTQRHFDKACELIRREGLIAQVSLGSALKRIAKNIANWHFVSANVRFWQHPFQGNAVGTELKKNLQSNGKQKLPDDNAILALAEIFSNGFHEEQDDEDIFITSMTCLLLSAPMRINEMLWFRVDPLHQEMDTYGNEQLYISYWVPKNGRYVRKEVPSIMASFTKEAVKRLTRITEEGRRLALHYESNSTKFYRHANCPNVTDDQTLTREEVVDALGFKNTSSAEFFLRSESKNYKLTGWTLNTLWAVVLKKHKELNPYFPYQQAPDITSSGRQIKMSESLICLRYRQLSSTSSNTSPILLAPTNRDFYSTRVGNNNPNMNLFRKHGYGELALRSHQLRHFLNTMAQEAGCGVDLITQWSTRASSTQTRIYMHQNQKREAQKFVEQLNTLPPPAHKPITDSEYKLMEKGPIITTRYGICSHDYTLTPCQKHADCLNCSELLMCKGHTRSIDAIKQERNWIADNLNAAKIKIDAGERVASRWYDSHIHNLTRLDQLLKIMTDPSIENGSPIQMRGKDFNHENRIIHKKTSHTQYTIHDLKKIGIDYGEELVDCLRMLKEENDV